MTSVFEHPTILKFDSLLHKCWGAICSIGIDWDKPYQYISDEDWLTSEPLYKETELWVAARELNDVCQDYTMMDLKEEIDLQLNTLVGKHKQRYVESINIFLKEVDRISSRLNEYYADVVDTEDFQENEERDQRFDTDIHLIKNSIFSINYILKPYIVNSKSLMNIENNPSLKNNSINLEALGLIPIPIREDPTIGRPLIAINTVFESTSELNDYLAEEHTDEKIIDFIKRYTSKEAYFNEIKNRENRIEKSLDIRSSTEDKCEYLRHEYKKVIEIIEMNPIWTDIKDYEAV